MENVRPASPSDESREKYRRSGYDKQGDAGAGSSRPEFVRILMMIKSNISICFVYLSVLVLDVVVEDLVVRVVLVTMLLINNRNLMLMIRSDDRCP